MNSKLFLISHVLDCSIHILTSFFFPVLHLVVRIQYLGCGSLDFVMAARFELIIKLEM